MKNIFFRSKLIISQRGPGIKKKEMSCIKAFPFTIKTIEWKNQLDVKEDLQCYFFVQVYKFKPLYILYLDICIHKLFHVRFVTSHRKKR